MPQKDRWADATMPVLGPVLAIALIASFAVHVVASTRLLHRYRRALADVASDDARFAARWLTAALLAFGTLWSIWGMVLVWDWFVPLGYTGLMWLYLLIAGVALFLAVEGWRHAGAPYPTMAALVDARQAPDEAATRNWPSQGCTWAAQVAEAGWARRPDLDLATLARLLGTNTAYLSRALNEGLGVNFSTFVNGLRCQAVIAALDGGDPRDVLTLALEAGFASKASFNRAFRAATDTTPSRYRADVAEAKKLGSLPDLGRQDAASTAAPLA